MNITLSPQRADSKSLVLHVSAETLTVNGKRFDFSELVEGNLLPAAACDSELIAGNITRTDGKISIAIILPLPADAGEAARFPEPILGAEGKIKLPQEYPDAEDFVPSQGTIDWLQAKTAEQQTDAGRVQMCTPAQGLVALFALKQIKESDVLAAIEQIADPVQQYTAQISYQRATYWSRTSAAMLLMADLLSLTDADLDALFAYAVTVEV